MLRNDAGAAGWLSGAFLLQGQLDRQQGHYTEAGRHFQQALTLLEVSFPTSKLREKAKIWLEVGKTHYQEERSVEALTAFENSLGFLIPPYEQGSMLVTGFYPDNTILDAFTGQERAAERLGNARNAM